MTARARKQPDRGAGKGRTAAARKRQASGPGLLQRSLLSLGAFAARHPSIVGGGAAFAVVFSFVAANALWYQPGGHPSPILKTRSGQNTLGFSALREEPSDVTTFVIRREGEEQAEGGGGQDAGQPNELVLDIQTELARQGFYAGDPDGRLQEETVSAIRRFQQERGLSLTGTPDAGLLAALLADAPQQVAVLPTERPLDTGGASEKGTEIDPVAAAIRAAEADTVAAPAAASATPAPAPAPAGPGPSSALVMKIQKGLSNIAYADITVDGVAGSRTREAIRAFEKHYRLPATGEPNELVLNKLKEIGAL
ncbi:peptidoglycan-binding protein (plasmid) [Rhizobium sp. TRM96647]|uniref:peptidoglycan-binding domain-containing protein n=1 Tax=unclassified Rhizobium TaxID=2613769 RepID=UPI0021E772ED|nr:MULTISPECIES: peptidoglycan-binding domain-containing protein [unclassified Rhizobium]MCV3735686.1 peptidoglycan-binding protein [Rhizobium sp. TRM96647]MCV3757551.1 peptidoglycan-binding protein [Rhizobium sp. TRM96650]